MVKAWFETCWVPLISWLSSLRQLLGTHIPLHFFKFCTEADRPTSSHNYQALLVDQRSVDVDCLCQLRLVLEEGKKWIGIEMVPLGCFTWGFLASDCQQFLGRFSFFFPSDEWQSFISVFLTNGNIPPGTTKARWFVLHLYTFTCIHFVAYPRLLPEDMWWGSPWVASDVYSLGLGQKRSGHKSSPWRQVPWDLKTWLKK